jgi:endonuclease YncB( thermonuclease family)
MIGPIFLCTVLSIVDGDGLKCRELDQATGKPIAVRLSAINARETRGHPCPKQRPCPAMSGVQSKRVLTGLVSGKVLRCEATGRSFNRVTAFCSASGMGDISCAMIRAKAAVRWAAYDPRGRLARCR